MSIRQNLSAAVTSAALLLTGGVLFGLTLTGFITDLRAYRNVKQVSVFLETVRTAQRRVNLEVTTDIAIDVELRVRHNGVTHDLAGTYMGATAQQVADIRYLVAGKGKEIDLWVGPQWNRFWVTLEFPGYRVGPLVITMGFFLLGLWGLYRSFQAEDG